MLDLRRGFTACLLALAASSGACTGPASDDQPGRTSADSAGQGARSLATMSPQLTRDLTPALARERFGAPDVETGSGLIIYKYALEGGDTLALGFPGFAPITYAQRLGANGAREQLTLR